MVKTTKNKKASHRSKGSRPKIPTRSKTPEPLSLRILSYNIHQGITVSRKRLSLSVLKQALKALDADIVLLQEVAGRAGQVPPRRKIGIVEFTTLQLEAIADELWPYYAYGKNAVFTGGYHGNAILSKYPIKTWQHVDITVKGMPKRGLIHAVIEHPKHPEPLHAVVTHLGLLQYERKRQMEIVCEYLRTEIPRKCPLLLGGDFNDWRQKITHMLTGRLHMSEAFLFQDAKHAKTFPSRFPLLKLDRIYFRGLDLTRAACLDGKPWFLFSDHLPVMADFLLTSE